MKTVGHKDFLSSRRRDCHIDLFRRFFLFFFVWVERDERAFWISLSLSLSFSLFSVVLPKTVHVSSLVV